MSGMDVTAVRTFVTVADAGQFQEAATDLSVTPQAVSKRMPRWKSSSASSSSPGTHAERGSPSTGRRSCPTLAGSSKPLSGPSTPYGQDIGRCAST
jgi:hypothetical protein